MFSDRVGETLPERALSMVGSGIYDGLPRRDYLQAIPQLEQSGILKFKHYPACMSSPVHQNALPFS